MLRLGLRRHTFKLLGRVQRRAKHQHSSRPPSELPIPEPDEVDAQHSTGLSELIGLAVNVERALAFAHRVVLPHLDEFRDRFPIVGSGS